MACFMRLKNLSRCVLLPPYTPASLSPVYSRIFRRASGGSCGDNNIRLMMAAERPEPLWLALRMVHVVLRASPSAFDCSSSVRSPASTRACPTSLIFSACRAFISATTGFLFFSCNELSPDRPVVKPAPNSSVVLLKSARIARLADVSILNAFRETSYPAEVRLPHEFARRKPRHRVRGCFLVVQTLWAEKFSQQPLPDR
jgi:hypothetical protein